jgi:predicted transcriptional regulator
LEAKGCVSVDRRGSANVFTASLSREQLLQQRLSTLADEYCQGDTSPLVLALVRGQRLSHDDVTKLRELIEHLDQKRRRRQSPKKK